MKDVGIAGLPYSGKSTLFTALTRTGAAGGRPNQAVVPVPDARLPELARLEGSRKIVPAQVRFIDVPGGLSAHALAALREADALCIVLRAFGPDDDPRRDLAEIRSELILADLAVVESALEGARKRARMTKGRSAEVAALERAHTALSAEHLLSEATAQEDLAHLRALAPLTLKPWAFVANVDEGGPPADLPEGAVPVWASLEAETAGLDEDEARDLLREFGVETPGVQAVINACYGALDLITFLTANDQEAHAWEVRRGATAPEAAGVIHSDMQRGFIRAEALSYDDLIAAGGWDAARSKGLVRVEGKGYLIREGDVLQIRFAI